MSQSVVGGLIMKAILRREREQFFTGKILFLIFGCVLFSLSARQSTSLSYMQFVLHMLSEHYYITYFMIPVFLLVISLVLHKNNSILSNCKK